MNHELLRIVDALHREKNVDKETIFRGIEAALLVAARRQFDDPEQVSIRIDRKTGEIIAEYRGERFEPELLGRIAAQTSKQVILQKIREAERDMLYREYSGRIGELVQGTVSRVDRAVVSVTIDRAEAILPRSEQIPGDRWRPGQPVRAILSEVRRQNNRLRIVLSRTDPNFIRRLFEREIPEVADGIIQIKGVVREPGKRAKVAVVSADSRIDCVGACVGVRGSRIKNVLDELSGEKIDIVRWAEAPQDYIASALQPAQVDEVMLFPTLARAIVLVSEDQLSQAIGVRGLNVKLASRLTGWDIEIMTADELEEEARRAVIRFTALEGVTPELADRFIEHGILSYNDLTVLDPEELAEIAEIDLDRAATIRDQAERMIREGVDPAADVTIEDVVHQGEAEARAEESEGGAGEEPAGGDQPTAAAPDTPEGPAVSTGEAAGDNGNAAAIGGEAASDEHASGEAETAGQSAAAADQESDQDAAQEQEHEQPATPPESSG